MKVSKKATDRRAEAHICVEGKMQELEEYGEYVDPVDKAICCYVPVEEGDKVKIGGRFSGTTLVIAYDAVVDGVHRKAGSYIAKSVHSQKHKKIDTETFLYKIDNGIIDTEISVTSLSGIKLLQGEGPETIGTMELRLFITRQLGVSHALNDIQTYSARTGHMEDEEDEIATYKQIEPKFCMEFDKNSALLDKPRTTREQSKMGARRPGTEPWAIFRFHYRSKEAITEQKMKLAWDPNNKSKSDPHILTLEPVPALPIGTKPHKEDEDGSTRASTPMSHDAPLTHVKGLQKDVAPKSPTLPKKQPPKAPTTISTKPEMFPTIEEEVIVAPESTPAPTTQEGVNENFPARVFSKPSLNSATADVPVTIDDKPTANGDGASVVAKHSISGNVIQDGANGTPPNTEKQPMEVITADNPVDKPTEKPSDKDSATAKDTIAVAQPKDQVNGLVDDGAAKASSSPSTTLLSANSTATKPTRPTKQTTKRSHQVNISPSKKPVGKPAPIITAPPIAQENPLTQAPPATPTKRTAEHTNGVTPEIKRAKIATAPSTPTNLTSVLRGLEGSASPRPVSVERQVTEQRKKLETLRHSRLQTAKKLDQLEKQMAPYKQRMAEELERLNKELMEEEAAAAEDEEHLKASVEMLKEFETAEGGA